MTTKMLIICTCIVLVPWALAIAVWVITIYQAQQIKQCKRKISELELKKKELEEQNNDKETKGQS